MAFVLSERLLDMVYFSTTVQLVEFQHDYADLLLFGRKVQCDLPTPKKLVVRIKYIPLSQ
jgi:hypothetical protein